MDAVVAYFGPNRNAVYKLLRDARWKIKSQLQALGYDHREAMDLFKP